MTLNISANNFTSLTGIGNLQQLFRLNAAFNQITSLEGLATPRIPKQLRCIDIHGNKISQLQELNILKYLPSLEEVTLNLLSKGNPVCFHQQYHTHLFSLVSTLQKLDGKDRFFFQAISNLGFLLFPLHIHKYTRALYSLVIFSYTQREFL